MFQRLTSSFQLYLALTLVLVIIGLGIALKFSYAQADIKQAQFKIVQNQKQVLQQDLNNAAAQLLVSERDKHRLRQQIKLVSKLNIKNSQLKDQIAEKLRSSTAQISQLRESDNETVHTWANTPVPSDAWRLLVNSANSANSDIKKDRIPVRPKRDDQYLPAPDT